MKTKTAREMAKVEIKRLARMAEKGGSSSAMELERQADVLAEKWELWSTKASAFHNNQLRFK